MAQVNLFLVGAMRAGSTSVATWLAAHPQIFVGPIKEPNHFIVQLPKALYEPDPRFSLETYFEKEFPKPLHIAHVVAPVDYEKLYQNVDREQRFLLDASAAYLAYPEAPSRIHAYNPSAKILVILRNPMERMISHYKMNVGLGKEKRTFQQIVREELAHYQNGTLRWYDYMAMSFYDAGLEGFKQYFKEVMVLNFDDLKKNNPHIISKQVGSFLKIDFEDLESIGHYNASHHVRLKSILRSGRHTWIKSVFSKNLSSALKRRVFRVFITKNEKAVSLDLLTQEHLQRVFREHSSVYWSQETYKIR
ncbi:MAG TPA: sulfotransferase [Flavobacteriaceae bacterium]|nr:sulfotransferase [Flavobacteriaceae bacterium]MCB9213488.1 sulfotransferase [Alteromonas sp.]HPF12209.1 sulfotransferase [Flavobacteriaceae bacterium]HQU22004.1 sulfotransferase [Flavobacteriaceae bacterium]HQU65903.1 sulfotransferase [Flavobacteriaceae bacterium]